MSKIVDIKNLDVVFPLGKGYFKAINNASLHINSKEIVGLVGESGSGKSTIGRTLIALNSFSKGEISINGLNLPHNKENLLKTEKKHLVKSVQYIFQDPSGALNPNKTIRKALEDVYKDNFSYRDYLDGEFSKDISTTFDEAFWKQVFATKDITKHYAVKVSNAKTEEEIINDDFFIAQNNLYIEFKNKKESLSKQQVNKKLTDKQYLALLKELKTSHKADLAKIKKATEDKLSKIVVKKVKYVPNNQNVVKILEKISRIYPKKELTLSKLKKLVEAKAAKNFPKDTEAKITELNRIISAKKLKEAKDLKDEAIKDAVESASLNWDLLDKKPDTLSGGQQQRAVIARALIVQPKILVADEPISALDVSIQSQVINAIKDLRETKGISILFIAHDLHVVRNISDRIVVIYRGDIVEEGLSDEIFKNAVHPYTRALLKAIPDIIHHDLAGKTSFKFKKTDERKWIKISKTHRVFCETDELPKWKKEVKNEK